MSDGKVGGKKINLIIRIVQNKQILTCTFVANYFAYFCMLIKSKASFN